MKHMELKSYHRVLAASPARSGSMWVYNVTRSMLIAEGYKVTPHPIPPDETLWLERSNHEHESLFCIKTHKMIPMTTGTKIICPVRDLLSATLSHLKFMGMEINFDNMVKRLVAKKEVVKYYQNLPGVLLIDYSNIVNQPMEVAIEIYRYLELTIPTFIVERIVQTYDKIQVQKFIDKLNKMKNEECVQDDKYILLGNENHVRVYHAETAFQSGHITNTGVDEWKQYFTPSEQNLLLQIVNQ